MNNLETNLNELKDILNLSKKQIEDRKLSLLDFSKNGFPSKKDEEWKFIDLNRIISSKIPKIKFSNNLVSKKIENKEIFNNISKNLLENNYVISKNGLITDIVLDHEDKNKFSITKIPLNIKEDQYSSLGSLNKAFYLDYLKLVIKENYKFKKPVLIINYSSPEIENTVLNQRFDLIMEKNSCMSILDLNWNLSENFIISSGSECSKNEIECDLKEKFSSAFVNGIINLDLSKQHEIRSKINHLSENTKSYQLIKCALKDKSKAVYQGKIFVDSVAQKTDGYQLSKAILLNEGTEFNGKPELEIYADDVKCSHGSSSGNLDENKIFYLMTRGLSKNEAKKILLDGFFLEVIEKITDTKVKDLIKELMKIR